MKPFCAHAARREKSCHSITALCAVACVLAFIAGAADAPPPHVAAPLPPVPSLFGPPTIVPTTPGNKPDTFSDLRWSADRQLLLQEKNALILSGSAWLTYQGGRLEADQIVFFRTTREVYAEGHVRLKGGDSEVSASALYLDAQTETGYFVDATLSTHLSADQNRQLAHKKSKDLGPRATVTADSTQDRDFLFLEQRDPYGVFLDTTDDPQARRH